MKFRVYFKDGKYFPTYFKTKREAVASGIIKMSREAATYARIAHFLLICSLIVQIIIPETAGTT